jgi:hypothetical protein
MLLSVLLDKIWIGILSDEGCWIKASIGQETFLMLHEGVSMDNFAQKGEPRGIDGLSVESEYSIRHPLIGNQS